MRYIIVNRAGIPLNSFYPNDHTGGAQLHHSRKSYMFFASIKEAEAHIDYIQRRATGKSSKGALSLRAAVEA